MEAKKDYDHHPQGFSEEVPNLSYVFGLVKNDFEFKNKFLAIIKSEFPMELERYLFHMRRDEPRAAAELVHKLKYRISALGMDRSFELTENHEERLHIGDTSLDLDFRSILKKIVGYLENI